MSHGRAIDPLPLGDFPTEQDASDPGFEQLFADSVGIWGSDADGFDADVAAASAILDALDGALGALGGLTNAAVIIAPPHPPPGRPPVPGDGSGSLDDTFADIELLDPQVALDDVTNLGAAIPDVNTNVNNLGGLIGAAALPAPPSSGAGGIPIASATGPFLPCNAYQNMGPAACSSYPCSTTVPSQNPLNVALTISMTLVQLGTTYTATTDCSGTLQPGETCHFTITATTQPAPDDQAQLQIAYNQPGSPAVFCVDGGALAASGNPPPSPGGGTGGGGPIQNPVALQ